MKNFKRLIALMLCVVTIFSLAACGKKEEKKKAADTTNAPATEEPAATEEKVELIDTVKLDMTLEEAKAQVTEAGCTPVVITVYDDTKADGDVLSLGEFMKDAKSGDYVAVAVNDLTIKDTIKAMPIAPRVITKASYDSVMEKADDTAKKMIPTYYTESNSRYYLGTETTSNEYSRINGYFESAGYTADNMFDDYVTTGLIPVPTAKLIPEVLSKDNCKYTENNGEITITSYTGTSQNIVVPATIDSKPVTTIATNAFIQTDIHALTTESNLTTIESGAFASAYMLLDIELSPTVMELGANAFNNAMITETSEDGFTTLDETILLEYTGTATDIVIPDTVQYIGFEAFRNKSAVTNVTFPAGLRSIGEAAFQKCSGLTTLTFPEGLLRISTNAFNDATKLTSITLPASLIEVGDAAFKGCTEVASIALNDGLKKIGNESFVYCLKTTDLFIPASVEYVGNMAFMNCQVLATVSGGEGLTYMGYNVFEAAPWFIEFNKGKDFTIFGNGMLIGCSVSDAEVIVPAEVKCISGAFMSLKTAEKIVINDGCAAIADKSFTDTGKLVEVTIPASVTYIGEAPLDISRASEITINAEAGSVAETYAKENLFKPYN